MKILIINTLYHPFKVGGAEVSVQFLAEELVASGEQVRVICLHDLSERKQTTLNGVEVVYLPLKNLYWPFDYESKGKISKIAWHILDNYNPLMAKVVGRELDEFSPDVVHTNNISGFSVSVWDEVKERNIRLVHTTRDYYLFHHNCTLFSDGGNMDASSKKIRALSYIKRLKSQKVDAFVGISKYISNLHKDNGYAFGEKHIYIYNPIKQLSINNNVSSQIRIGFIGRLTADKGFSEFCTIAEKMSNYTDVEFCAAGRLANTPEGEGLRDLANRSKVKLLGFVPVDKYLADIDILLLPTKWNEPFGRVVAEGASAGKHVFTTFMGGIKEVASFYDNVHEISEFNIETIRRVMATPISLPKNKPFDVMSLSALYKDIYKA